MTQEQPETSPPENLLEETVQSGLVDFAEEPVSLADQTAVIEETPPVQQEPPSQEPPVETKPEPEPAKAPEHKPLLTKEQYNALREEAISENEKADFIAKVMEARRPPEPPLRDTAPLAPRIVEQTNAELAAGRAMVEQHAANAARRSPPVPDKGEGKSVEVLRPDTYVPDPKKNQGHVGAQPLPGA